VLVVTILVTATLSAVLGLFLIVNLILLQMYFYKTGSRNAIVCGGISLILMTGARLVAYRFLLEQFGPEAAFDVALPFALTFGLLILNLRVRGQQPAAWIRVVACYALAVAIVLPSAWLTYSSPEIKSFLHKQMIDFGHAFGMETVDQALLDFSLDLFIKAGPLFATLVILFCWYAATRFQRRPPIQWWAGLALANFRIAEYMVWPLLVGLAGFGAGRVVSLPPAVDVGCAVLSLGMVFLYTMQGLGIVSAFFARRRNPGMRRIALPLVLAILFLMPFVNVALLVALPLMGVLEIWIRMRPATHDVTESASRVD